MNTNQDISAVQIIQQIHFQLGKKFGKEIIQNLMENNGVVCGEFIQQCKMNQDWTTLDIFIPTKYYDGKYHVGGKTVEEYDNLDWFIGEFYKKKVVEEYGLGHELNDLRQADKLAVVLESTKYKDKTTKVNIHLLHLEEDKYPFEDFVNYFPDNYPKCFYRIKKSGEEQLYL